MNNSTQIERSIELKAPVSRVWRALTDHREFGAWFALRFERAFEPGQAVTGTLTVKEYEGTRMQLTVRAMQPESLFSFNWHPYAVDPKLDYSQETPTLVEFRLEKMATGTRVTVVESGFDKVPAHRRLEAFRMNEQGWDAQLRNIERYVAANA